MKNLIYFAKSTFLLPKLAKMGEVKPAKLVKVVSLSLCMGATAYAQSNTPWTTTGDIGIGTGTVSPSAKLHVVGGARFEQPSNSSSNIAATFQGEISLTNTSHASTIKYGSGMSEGASIELWSTHIAIPQQERSGQINLISSTALRSNAPQGSNPPASDGLIRFMNSDGSSWKTNMTIYPSGKISIGDVDKWTGLNGDYKLYVRGGILTERVRVATYSSADWADYVFAPTYKLPSLAETQRYTQQNRHLPNVPSAEDVEKHGYDLPAMDARLLEKVEEAYLHLFEMEARVKALEAELARLNALQNKQ